MTFDIWAATLKGPYCLSASFGVPSACFRFVPSNQTFDPISKVRYFVVCGDSHSYVHLSASCAAVHALIICDCRSWIPGSMDGLFGWCANGV